MLLAILVFICNKMRSITKEVDDESLDALKRTSTRSNRMK